MGHFLLALHLGVVLISLSNFRLFSAIVAGFLFWQDVPRSIWPVEMYT